MRPATRPLTHAETIAWVRLARTPRVGPVTFARLMAEHHDPEEALDALRAHHPAIARGAPSAEAVARDFEALVRFGGRWVTPLEPDYPFRLAEIAAPPPVLAIKGDATLGQKRTVALVGARDASAAGLHLAQTLAQDLAAAGVIVVSGLARGVDTRAHEAALETGTIAVLGGGLDQPYPPENAGLQAAIGEKGLLVTDAALGYAPRARDFPRRNAIIAGISEAVVVVEASARSGALMTAHAAVELGRDAMAVPGSPLEPRARGANQLIREGAALIESAEDILAALGAPRRLGSTEPRRPALEAPSTDLVARVAQVLSPTPLHLNAIARAAGAPAADVAAALVELELIGQALSESGGFAARVDRSDAD